MNMSVTRPIHPLQRWIESAGIDFDALAKRCRATGFTTKPVYLKQIASGYYRPSYELASVLAKIIGKGTSVDEIMTFPYLRHPGEAA